MKHAFTFQRSALATLTLVCAGASAQSSVTIYGIVDATVMVGKGSVANKTQLGNSGYNTTRFGFRGTEDLGAGLKAGFVLEAGFNNDDGSGAATNPNNQGKFNPATGKFTANGAGGGGLTFNRRSMLTLSSTAGELRLGRDYTPQFWNYSYFDPFTMNGVGTSQIYPGSLGGPTTVRASNSVGYVLPAKLSGIYGQAQYYFGENAGTEAAPIGKKDGSGMSARLGYLNGPLNLAVALSKTDFQNPGDITTFNAGLSYDFGAIKLSAMYDQDKVGNFGKGTGYLLGFNAPVGPVGELRGSISRYKADLPSAAPYADKLALGYIHNLSKRTAVYTMAAYLKNKNGANFALNGATTAANKSSTGLDIGIRHSF
ncbi:MAG: porin [Burkholderiaceae bacterium]|nr:porin [Burkholderiaceae bacterium]